MIKNTLGGVNSSDYLDQLYKRDVHSWGDHEKQGSSVVNIADILSRLVEQVGKALNVDRAFLIEFNSNEPIPLRVEYIRNDSIESLRGVMPPWSTCPFLKRTADKQLTFADDALEDEALKNDPIWDHSFRESRIRGFVACPIYYEQSIFCVLVLHTQEPRHWQPSELALVQVACSQTAVSMYQTKLAAMQETYQLILDGSNDGLWEWDIEKDEGYWNKRFCEILGVDIPPSERSYYRIQDFVHPEDQQKRLAAIQQHLENGDRYEVEFRLVRADGEVRYLVSRGQAQRNAQGQPVRMAGALTDITERKLAEQAALEREQRFRLMAEASPMMIWMIDETGKLTYVNQQSLDFVGLTPEKLAAGHAPKVHPDDLEATTEAFNQAVATQSKFEAEYRIQHASGDYRWILSIGAPYFDMESRLLGFVGSGLDIDQRKKAEQALRVAEERYRLILEGSQDGIWDWDMSQNVVYTNQVYKDQIGMVGEVDVQAFFEELIHPNDQQRVKEAVSKAADPATPYEIEFRLKNAQTGQYITVLSRAKIIKDENGKPIRMTGVHTDLTERKRLEEELQSYAKRLEQSNRELEQFASLVSHDLQNPLRKLIFFSDMIKEVVPTEAQDTARRLQVTASRMQALITNLLSLSRVNRKGRPFRRVHLNDLVAAALDDLEISVQETNAEISVQPLAVVDADAGQLQQVFQNLIGNSIKFRRANTRPIVSIRGHQVDQNTYQVTVEDNGIGFKEEYLEKIFEPFERLHTDSQYPGSGLGLAIVKKIIERHGGMVSAENKTNEPGSKFCIKLPIQQPLEPEPHRNSSRPTSHQR